MTPPHKILISSDGSVIEFVRTNLRNKEIFYVYKYIQCEEKTGEVEYNEAYLKTQLTQYFKPIE